MLLKKLSQSFKITLAVMLSVLSTGILQVAPAYATSSPTDARKELICHATNSDANPYTVNEVDKSSIDELNNVDLNGHGDHTGPVWNATLKELKIQWGDIIPPFTNDAGVSYPGYNWTPEGQAIYNNGTCDGALVQPAGELSVATDCEKIILGSSAIMPADATVAYEIDGVTASEGGNVVTAGPHKVELLVNGEVVATQDVVIAECDTTTQQIPVSPEAPDVRDICGTSGDTITLPNATDQISYALNGNVVTATLFNPTTHDFGTDLNGYVVAQDGTTATYTATFPNNQPCLTATPCSNPANGGVITQNSDWTLAGGEFVDGGVEFTSNNWSASYIGAEMEYMISEALELGWTIDGSVSGASGTAIIFVTASGANIHYEPEPYTDDFWTNTPGILPVSGGGQGGTYSGSLQDLLDMGDQTITETYFYFNSQTANTITLESLSFNCTTYTFDKEGEVLGEDKVMICHATSSVMNPYNKISVSVNAANGGNDNGDHYNEHDGPIFNPDTNKNGDDWGDIIPPIAGAHNGLNWSTQGQAIYNNPDGDCGYVAPVDSCPLVPGVQSDTTLCPPGQGGGQTLGSNTTKTTPAQTLGASTVLPAALPATGGEQNPMLILLASLMAYGIAYLFQGRRQLSQTRA